MKCTQPATQSSMAVLVRSLKLSATLLLVIAATPPTVWAESDPVLVVVERADQIRSALGFDLEILAALEVSPSNYQAIATSAVTYARTYETQLATAQSSAQQARRALVRSCGSATAFETASATLDARVDVLASGCSGLSEQLRSRLTPAQQAAHDRWLENVGLDPLLRLVSGLTEGQRAQLRTAKSRRDRALLNPRNWHRHPLRRHAKAQYEAAVEEILTASQSQELATLRRNVQANLEVACDAEDAALQVARSQVNAENEEKDAPVEQGNTMRPAIDLLRGLGRLISQSLRPWAGALVPSAASDTPVSRATDEEHRSGEAVPGPQASLVATDRP